MSELTPLPRRHQNQPRAGAQQSALGGQLGHGRSVLADRVQEEQQGQREAQYGTRLMAALSMALRADFGKGRCFANLYNFRQFFRAFHEQEILYSYVEN